jgi:putative tricarboxylic transport membrane protein
MMPRVFRNSVWLLTVLALIGAGANVRAADSSYPIKAIKVIVPFGPGGGSDTFVRIVQAGIRSGGLLPQPLTVINVPGAGGTIGSRRVKNSFGDGYTILNLHDGILSAKYSGQALYGPEAFKPIAATGLSEVMICVADSSRFKSLRELLETTRDEKGSVSFGANLGATSHFAGLRLEHAVPGAELRFVAAGGGAKRFASMKGGHLDASTFTVGEYLTFKDGGLRAIAILNAERSPDFPDVPTAREQDVNVIWDLMQYWWAPKTTSDSRVHYLAGILNEALNSADVRERFAELHIKPVFAQGAALTDLIAEREKRVSELSIRKPIDLPNFPLYAIVAVVALGIIAFGRRPTATAEAKPNASGDPNAPTSPSPESPPAEWNRLLACVAILVAYAALLSSHRLPFWAASLIFMWGLGFMLNKKTSERLWLGSAAIVVAVGCQLIFTRILVVDLP